MFRLNEYGSGHKCVISIGDRFSVIEAGMINCNWFLLFAAALTCTHLNIIIFVNSTDLI